MASANSENCPKCGSEHIVGPYYKQTDNTYSPNDVKCGCGLILRWIVPIFKQSPSGYLLVPKADQETLRDSHVV